MNAPKGMTPIQTGTENGIEWAIVLGPVHAINGYVQLPEDHPWVNQSYDDMDVDVHGGLTYAAGRWIGFDTAHSGDHWPNMPYEMPATPWDIHWTEDAVIEETKELARKVSRITGDSGRIPT